MDIGREGKVLVDKEGTARGTQVLLVVGAIEKGVCLTTTTMKPSCSKLYKDKGQQPQHPPYGIQRHLFLELELGRG